MTALNFAFNSSRTNREMFGDLLEREKLRKIRWIRVHRRNNDGWKYDTSAGAKRTRSHRVFLTSTAPSEITNA